MVESATYWVCRCGKANDNGLYRCDSCQLWRRQKFVIPLFICAGVAFVALFGRDNQTSPIAIISTDELAMQSLIEAWKGKILASPNEVASRELMLARNTAIFDRFGGREAIRNWEGTVKGISAMQKGAGVAITVPNANFVAGIHVGLDLNTLISPSDALYGSILKLKTGDKILFSGQIQHDNENRAIILNYSTLSSLTAPDILFRITAIRIQPIK
jgi:hypothetical protein